MKVQLIVFPSIFLILHQTRGQHKFNDDPYYDARYISNYPSNLNSIYDQYQYEERLPDLEALKGHFPKLTPKQKSFAVNPAYKSFYDERYKDIEGVNDYKKLQEAKVRDNDEVIHSPPQHDVQLNRVATANPFSNYDQDQMGDYYNDQDDSGDQLLHDNSKKAIVASALSTDPNRFRELDSEEINNIYFTTIVAVSSALAVFAIVGAGFCYNRVQRNSKASEDVEYPAYGVTGPGGKESSPTGGSGVGGGGSGDRKLAQSAQMYHYQHQKQQMIAFDTPTGPGTHHGNGRGVNGTKTGLDSDCESEDGEEGDYTVYECPGLAPTGEMEVRNPLFQDEPTPKSLSRNGN